MPHFFQDFDVIPPQKKRSSVFHMGPLLGPLKSMGPGFIVPPCPPLGGPATEHLVWYNLNVTHTGVLSDFSAKIAILTRFGLYTLLVFGAILKN